MNRETMKNRTIQSLKDKEESMYLALLNIMCNYAKQGNYKLEELTSVVEPHVYKLIELGYTINRYPQRNCIEISWE